MLVVLRVKEIPSDSSEGILFSGYRYIKVCLTRIIQQTLKVNHHCGKF